MVETLAPPHQRRVDADDDDKEPENVDAPEFSDEDDASCDGDYALGGHPMLMHMMGGGGDGLVGDAANPQQPPQLDPSAFMQMISGMTQMMDSVGAPPPTTAAVPGQMGGGAAPPLFGTIDPAAMAQMLGQFQTMEADIGGRAKSALEADAAGDTDAMLERMAPIVNMVANMFRPPSGQAGHAPPAPPTREEVAAIYRSTMENLAAIVSVLHDGDGQFLLQLRAVALTQLSAFGVIEGIIGADGRPDPEKMDSAVTLLSGIQREGDEEPPLDKLIHGIFTSMLGMFARQSMLTPDELQARCDAAVERARLELESAPHNKEGDVVEADEAARLRKACTLLLGDIAVAILSLDDETAVDDPAFDDALLASVRNTRDMANGTGFVGSLLSTAVSGALKQSKAAKDWRRALDQGEGPARARLDAFLQCARLDDPKVLRLFEAANAFRRAFAAFAEGLSAARPVDGVGGLPAPTDLRLLIADLATELSDVAVDEKTWNDGFLTASPWAASLRPALLVFPERVSAQPCPLPFVAELFNAFIDLCAAAGETGRLHAAGPLMPKGPRELKRWLTAALMRSSELSDFSIVLMTNRPTLGEENFAQEGFREDLVAAALCFLDGAFTRIGLPDEDVGTKHAAVAQQQEKDLAPEILPVD